MTLIQNGGCGLRNRGMAETEWRTRFAEWRNRFAGWRKGFAGRRHGFAEWRNGGCGMANSANSSNQARHFRIRRSAIPPFRTLCLMQGALLTLCPAVLVLQCSRFGKRYADASGYLMINASALVTAMYKSHESWTNKKERHGVSRGRFGLLTRVRQPLSGQATSPHPPHTRKRCG